MSDNDRELREARAEIAYLKECVEKAVSIARNDKIRANVRVNIMAECLMTAWRGRLKR